MMQPIRFGKVEVKPSRVFAFRDPRACEKLQYLEGQLNTLFTDPERIEATVTWGDFFIPGIYVETEFTDGRDRPQHSSAVKIWRWKDPKVFERFVDEKVLPPLRNLVSFYGVQGSKMGEPPPGPPPRKIIEGVGSVEPPGDE